MSLEIDNGTSSASPNSDEGPKGPYLGDHLLLPPDSDTIPVLSFVLPTLNEEEGIGACIVSIKDALATLGVTGEIIVCDSSTDRTPQIARNEGAIVVTPDTGGYGYAYRYGFQIARGDYIIMGDADTTYDFSEVPNLLEPIINDEADIVLGSRFEGDIEPGAMPSLHRFVGNPLLTKFLNIFYDADVTDAHSGFRVFKREVLDELNLHSDGMEFASEMVMQAATMDLRIEEVPIIYHERAGEETLDSFRDGWRHVKFMLTNAPGYIFTIPCIGFLIMGVGVMGASLFSAELANIVFRNYTMIAGSLLTILGYQVGSLAVFSSVAADPVRKPTDPITKWIRTTLHLEHGVLLGLILFSAGTIAAASMIVELINSGPATAPPLTWSLLSFTVIVLGVQTIFYSLFFSMLAQTRRQSQEVNIPNVGKGKITTILQNRQIRNEQSTTND